MKSKRADRAIMDLSQEAGDFGIDTAVVLIDDARKAVGDILSFLHDNNVRGDLGACIITELLNKE